MSRNTSGREGRRRHSLTVYAGVYTPEMHIVVVFAEKSPFALLPP